MATEELVLVFFRSSNKLDWVPMDRDTIPEWLKSEEMFDRLIAGECVRNIEAEDRQGMMFYTAMAINRKEPLKSAIILPERAIMRHS